MLHDYTMHTMVARPCGALFALLLLHNVLVEREYLVFVVSIVCWLCGWRVVVEWCTG